jgi:hypothetical protein
VPKWGLDKRQREVRPWGLDPEYLAPKKVITDPIHGDVFITELERIFIDTEPVPPSAHQATWKHEPRLSRRYSFTVLALARSHSRRARPT